MKSIEEHHTLGETLHGLLRFYSSPGYIFGPVAVLFVRFDVTYVSLFRWLSRAVCPNMDQENIGRPKIFNLQ